MTDQPIAARISEFYECARGTNPFCPKYKDAQDFFLKEVMGVRDRDVLDNGWKINPHLRDKFLDMASRTVDQITGTEIHVPQDIGHILGRLSEQEEKVRLVLDKVALRCGAREAVFGYGK